MASISSDSNGNRTIQFVAGDRKRRSIRLGKLPKKSAEVIKAKIEALNAAVISKTSWDVETAEWVGKLDSLLYAKLAKAGLVPVRAAAERAMLGAFLASYIQGRSDVKRGTKNVYRHTQECLVEYFGASKPLSEVSSGDADEWRRWLAISGKWADGSIRKKLGDNTIRRRCGVARQFFRAALRKRIITTNPFGEMKGISVRSNRERDFFISREDAAKVIDACPDAQWRLLFALSRFGGLRCPSEHLALTWGDIDWATKRMVVRSPKTEHHEGQGIRIVPIFPELKSYLDDVWEIAEEVVSSLDPKEAAKAHVITRYRDPNANLRTQFERIIARAGLKPWPKLFQNLRATRATELAAKYPSHVAADWMGHSAMVAQKHYWRTTDADFEKATAPEALHNPVQSAAVSRGTDESQEEPVAAFCGNPEEYGAKEYARRDSNPQPPGSKPGALSS